MALRAKVEGKVAEIRARVAAVSPRATPTSVPDALADGGRPVYLPPKDPKEAKRHAKLVKNLQKSFVKRTAQEQLQDQIREYRHRIKENLLASATVEWNDEVLPCWQEARRSRVAQLVRQGVPPSVRGRYWAAAIENSLQLGPELFQVFREKEEALAAKLQDRQDKQSDIQVSEEQAALSQSWAEIDLDLARTFPDLQVISSEDCEMNQQMRLLLRVYVCFRPDLGYVQGMSYLCAMFLLHMELCDAFVCLANLLEHSHLHDFYNFNSTTIATHVAVFESFLQDYVPGLAQVFREHGIDCRIFLFEWWITLFAKSLPLDLSTRIWDGYVLHGLPFLFRVGIALLRVIWPTLQGEDFDQCVISVSRIDPQKLDEVSLFEAIDNVNIDSKVLNQRLDQYSTRQ